MGGLDVGDALLAAMREEPLSAAEVVYCAGIIPPITGLWLYHNYLVCTNQTTYEQIKGAYMSGSNPFHRGILGNYRDVLCSPVRPRLFSAVSGEMRWPKAVSEDAREVKLSSAEPEAKPNLQVTQRGGDQAPSDEAV